MTKRRWVASVISLITSKRVVVAAVAATALVLGVMSVGAAILIQKKIADIADVRGRPYTPPQHPGERHTAQTGAPVVASASTTGSNRSPASAQRVTGMAMQPSSIVTPASPAHLSLSSVGALNPPMPDIAPPIVPPAVPPIPPAGLTPSGPIRHVQLPPGLQLSGLLVGPPPAQVRVQTPLISIGVSL